MYPWEYFFDIDQYKTTKGAINSIQLIFMRKIIASLLILLITISNVQAYKVYNFYLNFASGFGVLDYGVIFLF